MKIFRYDEALELLDAMIQEDETNASPRKRKIAILKAKGRVNEAIKELNEYLKKYSLNSHLYLAEILYGIKITSINILDL